MKPASVTTTTEVPTIGKPEARAIVQAALVRYVASRHERVGAFVDANFSLPGALRLHREALGLDLLRAPANVALMVPFLAAQLAAAGLQRLGARRAAGWLRGRRLFLTTDVARELTLRLQRDLLELPYADGARRSERDALAELILADPRLDAPRAELAAALRRQREDPAAQARRGSMLGAYADARSAAADLFNNALLAGTGAAVFQKLTPGTFTLRPVLAAAIAHQAAVASFPLGAAAGGLWYAWFPVQPSAGLLLGATGGLMLATAVTAGFAPASRAIPCCARSACTSAGCTG